MVQYMEIGGDLRGHRSLVVLPPKSAENRFKFPGSKAWPRHVRDLVFQLHAR